MKEHNTNILTNILTREPNIVNTQLKKDKKNTVIEKLGDIIMQGFINLNYIYITDDNEKDGAVMDTNVNVFPKRTIEDIQKLIRELSTEEYKDGIVSEKQKILCLLYILSCLLNLKKPF